MGTIEKDSGTQSYSISTDLKSKPNAKIIATNKITLVAKDESFNESQLKPLLMQGFEGLELPPPVPGL